MRRLTLLDIDSSEDVSMIVVMMLQLVSSLGGYGWRWIGVKPRRRTKRRLNRRESQWGKERGKGNK